jgi:hypothetical protein
MYGKLLAFYQLGAEARAEQALKKAFSVLPRVAEELVKELHPKPKDIRPGYVTHGGCDQAYYYWKDQGEHWKRTPGALDLVRAFLKKPDTPDQSRLREVTREMSPDFDIHGLEDVDLEDEEAEGIIEEFEETLVRLFRESPEGKERLVADPDTGTYVLDLLRFGVSYLGRSPTTMSVADVEVIVTGLIPRKLILGSSDEAEHIVPELVAFWEYLKREYNLPNADPIMEHLREIQPGFPAMMKDASRFGMGKTLFAMGAEAGFDMNTEAGIAAFIEHFNARRDTVVGSIDIASGDQRPLHQPAKRRQANEKARKKTSKMKRKSATKSRKANRRKRR